MKQKFSIVRAPLSSIFNSQIYIFRQQLVWNFSQASLQPYGQLKDAEHEKEIIKKKQQTEFTLSVIVPMLRASLTRTILKSNFIPCVYFPQTNMRLFVRIQFIR